MKVPWRRYFSANTRTSLTILQRSSNLFGNSWIMVLRIVRQRFHWEIWMHVWMLSIVSCEAIHQYKEHQTQEWNSDMHASSWSVFYEATHQWELHWRRLFEGEKMRECNLTIPRGSPGFREVLEMFRSRNCFHPYLVWGAALLGEVKWDFSPCHHCQRWRGSEGRDANKHSTPKSFSFVQAVKYCGSCKNSLSPDRGVPPLFYPLKTSEVPSYQEKSHF